MKTAQMPRARGWELPHSISWLLIRLYLLEALAVGKMPLARCQHHCRVPMSSNVSAKEGQTTENRALGRNKVWGEGFI